MTGVLVDVSSVTSEKLPGDTLASSIMGVRQLTIRRWLPAAYGSYQSLGTQFKDLKLIFLRSLPCPRPGEFIICTIPLYHGDPHLQDRPLTF